MMILKKELLDIKILQTRNEMGKVAAYDISNCIKDILLKKDEVNIIFAAAPSQNDVLGCLCKSDVDWSRVNAFHMDEYIGLPADDPQCFGNFLKKAIFDIVPFKSVNYIDSSASDIEAECERYAKILQEKPTDIVIMGIGENGHIAFNDPHVADFCDKKVVKPVELDDVCRMQQVNDGCFEKIENVPKSALTLTIPTLMKAKYHFCIVPAKTKADAVKRTLYGDVSKECPATILRTKINSVLYCDADSSACINPEDFQCYEKNM